MTRKHGIRAPFLPKGEQARVTIAMQDKQIKLLIDRVAELETKYRGAKDDAECYINSIVSYRKNQEDLERVVQRMRGWQDLARELLITGEHHNGGNLD